ncbi:MAG: hypothetical protein HY332_01965 [Chloroflexi bacterium]|nr:hypothetical protein [Chloroflexota bacterium]
MNRHLAHAVPAQGGPSFPGAIPDSIRASALMQKGGFDVLAGLLDEPCREQMLSEAVRSYATAQESAVAVSDREEYRGGAPARRFLSAPGGDVQDASYHAAWMLGFLREVTGGAPVTPSGSRGTYTYYARASDHLAIHRDVETCDLAVVTCLYNGPHAASASSVPATAGNGGVLCLYPSRMLEPLSAIRRDPATGTIGVRLLPGQTIVMFGGIVPHAVLPIGDHQVRIVSVLCYRIEARGLPVARIAHALSAHRS